MTAHISGALPMTEAAKPVFENGSWLWEKHYPSHVNWRMQIEAKPLFDIIDQAAKKNPGGCGIDFLGRTYTYSQINDITNKVARGLQLIGVKRGVKVGLFLPNTPYSIFFYFGVLKAGGTVVNYNPLYAERELVNQIADSETDIMVTLDLKVVYDRMKIMLNETRLQKLIICPMADVLPFPKNILFPVVKGSAIAKVARNEKYVWFKDIINNDGKPAPVDLKLNDDIAVLQYTGGTTGVPKGAMLTHANIYSNILQTAAWVASTNTGKDSIVGVLPFFHVFAMTVVMGVSIHSGFKIVMQPRFEVPEVLKLIKKHRPTYFPAVPAIFNAIANHPDVKKYDFSSLKFCISGGAPLPSDVRRLFEDKTSCLALAEGYGMTETSPVATCNPVGGKVKQGSIGLPLPGTIIEIVSREDGVTVLPIGEKGEVCIKGPQVMKGYYNKPDATADMIKNGRLHSGDVGYIDDEGYVYLVDRIKDMILVRGYNVYPRIVEEAIYLHPNVEECIVAGVPDSERGETVWAWVKTVNGRTLSEDELLAFLEDKLSPIERPRKINFRTTPLPKTAIGKLSRKDLLEQEGLKKRI